MAEQTQASEGSVAALLEFLSWAGRTGEMNPTTAEAWAVACRRVLGVDGDVTDEVSGIDVRSIDLDDYLRRFENLNRTKFTSGSLSTYKSRFVSAVTAYRSWLTNEPWKPPKRTSRKSATPATTTKAPSPPTPPLAAPSAETPAHTSTPLLVPYKMPLRPDLMVDIALPADLTVRDANRIAAFVKSLAFSPDESDESG